MAVIGGRMSRFGMSGSAILMSNRYGRGVGARTGAATGSFDVFYAAEFDRVLRTAALVTRDRGVAEEVTQEAFAKAYASWWRVSRYEMPDAWVRKVAMRMAIRQVQRRKAWEKIASTISAPDDHSDPEHPDERVAAAVGQLHASQRVATVLHYLEDRPIAEIAEIMDCAESTVKVHLHRARQKLAHVLGVQDGDA